MSFTEAYEAAKAEVTADEPETTEVEVESEAPEVEAAENVEAEPTEPASDEPTGPTYKVKVNGEEVEVTLEELQAGYSRTSDYTRKTQEVAADRQRLAQAEALQAALLADPQGTLALLAEQFGIGQDDEVDLDPEEARLQRLEAAEAARQEQARMDAIDASLGQLHQQYGEFDDVELLRFAVERNVADLTDAFKAMTFERIYEEAKAAKAAAKAKADEEATAAKRAATVIEGGTTRVTAPTEPARPERPTLREAFLMAASQ